MKKYTLRVDLNMGEYEGYLEIETNLPVHLQGNELVLGDSVIHGHDYNVDFVELKECK